MSWELRNPRGAANCPGLEGGAAKTWGIIAVALHHPSSVSIAVTGMFDPHTSRKPDHRWDKDAEATPEQKPDQLTPSLEDIILIPPPVSIK